MLNSEEAPRRPLTYSQLINRLVDNLTAKKFNVDFSGGKVLLDSVFEELAALPDFDVDPFVHNAIYKIRSRSKGN